MDKTTLLSLIHFYAEEYLPRNYIPGKTYIPPTYPSLTPRDVEMVGDALLNFWWTEHKYCRKFEKALTDFVGKRHAVLCNSGSSASLLAMTAAVEGTKEKFVVTTALGFPTTVSPIYQNGKLPIYIDIDPRTLQPDLEGYKIAIDHNDDIAAAIFTHTLGFHFFEPSFYRYHYPLIADCCDALGGVYFNGDRFVSVGTHADMMTISFFPAHQIMTVEGGVVLCNFGFYHESLLSLANWGRSCYCRPGESNTCGKRFEWEDRGELPEGYDHKYIFDRLGYNTKMTEFQAALGVSQMERVESFAIERLNNFKLFRDAIAKHGGIRTVEVPEWSVPSPFGFPIMTDTEFPTEKFIAYLEEHKVGTRRLFGGNLTRQPGFMNLPYKVVGDLSGTDYLMTNCFWISVSPTLTSEMKVYMIETIDNFFKEV